MSEPGKNISQKIEQAPVAEPISVETPSSVEQPTQKVDFLAAEKISEQVVPITPTSSLPPVGTPVPKEVERQAEIERILEDDLGTVYFNLPDDKKEMFRIKGEQTAYEINGLLSATKIKVQKIIKLIKNWLLIIPGVNRFFLEQEAKLKTDEIIKLNDKF